MKTTRELRKISLCKCSLEPDEPSRYYFTVTQTGKGLHTEQSWMWEPATRLTWYSPLFITAARRNQAMRKFKAAWVKFMDEVEKI